MDQIRKLFAQFMSARSPQAPDPSGSRVASPTEHVQRTSTSRSEPWQGAIASTQSAQAQRDAQRDAEMSELRKVFARYMASVRPPDTSDSSKFRNLTPIEQAPLTPVSQGNPNLTPRNPVVHHFIDEMYKASDNKEIEFTNDDDVTSDVELDLEVETMGPHEAQTDLKVFNVEEVSPTVEKPLNPVAHKAFDEMPTRIVSKKIDEHIPLQSLLAGNSLTNQVKLLICGELLSFDPGGEMVLSGINILDCLWISDELSRGNIPLNSKTNGCMRSLSILQRSLDLREEEIRVVIEPFLEGTQSNGMLPMSLVPAGFSYASLISLDDTKLMVDAYGCEIPIFDPGGEVLLLGGESLHLEHVDQELQWSNEMRNDITRSFQACGSGTNESQSDFVAPRPNKIKETMTVYVNKPPIVPGGMVVMTSLISGNSSNLKDVLLKKRELHCTDEEWIDLTNLSGACLPHVDVKPLILLASDFGDVKGSLPGMPCLMGVQQLVFDPGITLKGAWPHGVDLTKVGVARELQSPDNAKGSASSPASERVKITSPDTSWGLGDPVPPSWDDPLIPFTTQGVKTPYGYTFELPTGSLQSCFREGHHIITCHVQQDSLP